MNCPRYKNWMSRTALGALNAVRETDLCLHLTACLSCRRQFERERELLEAIDQTLAGTSAGEPSADLYVRVRQKISERAVSGAGFGPAFPWRRLALTAVACAFALALGLAWRWHRPLPRGSAALTATAYRGQPAPTAIQPEAQPAMFPGNQAHGATIRHSERRISSRRSRRSASRQPPAPRVLVPRNEMALVLKLCNDARAGKIDGASLLAAPPGFKLEANGSLVVIPIKIKSLEIAAIDVGPAIPNK